MTRNHVAAAAFMHSVFEGIKHGDEKHQAWLKEECVKLVGDLEKVLDAAAPHVAGLAPSLTTDLCPKCNEPIMALHSGVKCSNVKCNWWECF